MDRRATTPPPPRRASRPTAAAAAIGARPSRLPACPSVCSTSLEPAEQAVRPDNDNCEIEAEHDQRLVGRIEQQAAERLDEPDQYSGDEAAENAAESAERHRDERQQGEIHADLRKDVIEGREQAAGHSDAA